MYTISQLFSKQTHSIDLSSKANAPKVVDKNTIIML